MQIKNKIKKTILKYNMIQPGDRIIVAVSGGPDSICLMDVLDDLSNEMEISLVIAHYEHGLRPEEDLFETNLVKKLAESFNLPFETEKALDLNKDSTSLEDRARELRYDFLGKIREKHKAQKIAIGHNLNDQAETIIMRLLRGSGMTGLSGIPPVRDNTIIRPLIENRRKDIIDYLRYRNLEFAIDSSNSDNRFLRNRIRQELLPELTKYQPELIEILGKLADNLRDENSFFETQAEKWIDEQLKPDEKGDFYLDINLLKDLPPAFKKRIIRNIVKRHFNSLYGIDSAHIQAILDLTINTKPNISVDLPGNLIIRKEYYRLIFAARIPNSDSFTYTYEIRESGEIYIDEIDSTLIFEELDNNQQAANTNDTNIAFLDRDSLPYPLIVRNFSPGDRFIPLGMTGHKKVKDFFIDMKILPDVRKKTPILLKDDNILWICGYRIDDRYKVTSKTNKILKITIC